jgi:hypothetical protein
MGWLRRRGETLNQKLMREAGLSAEPDPDHPEPLEPQALQRGPFFELPGATGIARARRWHTTAAADAPGLEGDEVDFVALPDGTILIEGEAGDASVAPLADAVERSLKPPYRARGARQTETTWGVAANPIQVVELPGQEGDEVDIAAQDGQRTLVVDGAREFGSLPRLEELGAARSRDYVVHAERLDGDLWEVKVSAL